VNSLHHAGRTAAAAFAVAALALGGSSPKPMRASQANQCIVTHAGDAGAGSLRACLSDLVPGTQIVFDAAAFPPQSPVTMTVSTPLPTIEVDDVTIDGQGAGVIVDGSALEALDPAQLPRGQTLDGLVVMGARNVHILGMHLARFPLSAIYVFDGARDVTIGGAHLDPSAPGPGNVFRANGEAAIWIAEPTTGDVRIIGNLIDMAAPGAASPGDNGIAVVDAGGPVMIGGDQPGEGNTILGSQHNGITLQQEARQVVVEGNAIGAAPDGTLGPNEFGIVVQSGANDIRIGGPTSGQRNIIAGNRLAGVGIVGDATHGVHVMGNLVGLLADGRLAPAAHVQGIAIGSGAHDNVIGGAGAGEGNVVGGSTEGGIVLNGAGVDRNRVEGNRVGTDPEGRSARGNVRGIVVAHGARENVIGGAGPGAGNLVSGNQRGISLTDPGTQANVVDGNRVGTDVTGMMALPNAEAGILVLEGASANTIGGAAGNLVAGNAGPGVHVQGVASVGNTILGNLIGTDASGTAALPNEQGVVIRSAVQTRVGGTAPGQGNVISGNTGAGVGIVGAAANGVQLLGNRIGTDAAGLVAVPNGTYGVVAAQAGSGHWIGDGTPGGGNLIGGNGLTGIALGDVQAITILGNAIGTDATGRRALGNGGPGIEVGPQSTDVRIGGPEADAGNVIGGNAGAGIVVSGPDTAGVTVAGNHVGASRDGRTALGNGGIGIAVVLGVTNSRVGGRLAEGNRVVAGASHGIAIQNAETTGIRVQGNTVGGLPADEGMGNAAHGIVLAASAAGNWIGADDQGDGNRIVGNGGAGIAVDGTDLPSNRFAANIVHDNHGLPIDYLEFDPSPVAPPRWDEVRGCALAGRACPGCAIELFDAGGPVPAARRYLGALTVPADGTFSVPPALLASVQQLSATASSSAAGPTSEMTAPVTIGCTAVILPALTRP